MFSLERLVAGATVCALVACGGDRSVDPVATKVDADNGVGIESANVVTRFDLLVGQRVTIKPRTTTRTSRLRWSSTNTGVAGVNSSGTVSANGIGTATVTVSGGWVAESYTVAVTAPVAPPVPTVTALTLQPATGVSLLPGQAQQFTPAATWSDGQQRPLSVTYTATGGTISSTGLFTAGSTAGRFSVIATCVCGLVATSTVDVAQLVSLTISPKTVSLAAGGTQAFSASALWGTGATALPPVSYSVTGGSITSTGQYTAPSTAGTYRVIVAHTNGSARDTATVTVGGGGGSSNPIPSTFGPGPNAPAWSGKTIYPQELFNTPIPVHYAGANAAGFKGYQGFDGAWGGYNTPTRVNYPTVATPLGTKPVLQVTFPGSTQSISSVNGTSAVWPTHQSWGVRVAGAWSGTLLFERSADGINWTPVSLRGTWLNGANLPTGSQATTNGVWVSDDAITSEFGKFRVRASSWSAGTAMVSIGMQGGAASARMDAGAFTGSPTRVYTRILVYVDPNWSNGGNAGTKFFFFSQEQGNNHYTGFLGSGGSDSRSGTFMGLQGGGAQGLFNRNLSGTASVPNGSWMDLEFVMIANTAGSANGVFRAWVNGVESQNATDVLYFTAGTTPRFNSFFMDPTYGGGEAPPPQSVFFRIAGWYRESAP